LFLEEKISDQRKQNRHRQFQRSEIAGKIPKLSTILMAQHACDFIANSISNQLFE
jgi:hypothetical protein